MLIETHIFSRVHQFQPLTYSFHNFSILFPHFTDDLYMKLNVALSTDLSLIESEYSNSWHTYSSYRTKYRHYITEILYNIQVYFNHSSLQAFGGRSYYVCGMAISNIRKARLCVSEHILAVYFSVMYRI